MPPATAPGRAGTRGSSSWGRGGPTRARWSSSSSSEARPLASVKLTLEYHGGGFAGWAAQPNLRTVEGVLEAALRSVTESDVTLAVAGRTDAGVHAWGQVASCEAPDEWAGDQPRLLRALNATLPTDVTVTAAEPMPPGFDARRDARSRRYCYRLLARPSPSPFERDLALWWPHPVDEGALAACAGALGGRHDFTAFTPTRTDHVRFERDVLGAEWRRNGDVWEFWIEADSFLRHMVRVLVGTMLEVGGGRRNREDFAALLDGAPRAAAGETAPAHGLYLAAVTY